jgi:hypothetical protein
VLLETWIVNGFKANENVPWSLFICGKELAVLVREADPDGLEVLVHAEVVIGAGEIIIVDHLPILFHNWNDR